MADGSAPFPPEPPKKPLKLTWGIRWAEDGMKVWIPWEREKGSAVRGEVTCATGDLIRVKVDYTGRGQDIHFERWFRYNAVLVEKGDPHGYDTCCSS